ncbi:MAG: endopeptidase La [Paludibacteraceae bacterium]|nr:endopeptidase La [Paludibacteraceae bacterium]
MSDETKDQKKRTRRKNTAESGGEKEKSLNVKKQRTPDAEPDEEKIKASGRLARERSTRNFIPYVIEGKNDFHLNLKEGELLPILAVRNMVLFPGAIVPITVARSKSLKLIHAVYESDGALGVVAQRDPQVENPAFGDLYPIGTVAHVVRLLDGEDGTKTVILEGKHKFELKELPVTKPFLQGLVSDCSENVPNESDREFAATMDLVKDTAMKILKMHGSIPQEITFALKNLMTSEGLLNYICGNFGISTDDKQRLLTLDIRERASCLLSILMREMDEDRIKIEIANRAKSEMDEQQRNYFLQQQIRAIQDELGDGPQNDIEKYYKRSKEKEGKWNDSVWTLFNNVMHRLERLNPSSPDYNVECNYVETLLNMPIGEFTDDVFNLDKVQKQLDKDHFGLDKVKERILEHLAVLKLKRDKGEEMKAPILCLYGPPGVGKTSLGRSIADALGRRYVRISLGGLHDEAEIRGHRRTYIGAMPGRIVQSLIKAKSSNPVFVLDELDKITGAGVNGDPSSAMLEVLDPEQNKAFHDNFLDMDVDLSNVMFIATANNISQIPRPLLDRMELIEVSGYVEEEKLKIAQKYLLPKELKENGLGKNDMQLAKDVLPALIESYTRESGVRELQRKIGKMARKIAYQISRNGSSEFSRIHADDLAALLGPKEYFHDKSENENYYGVVTGLAWTAVGGEILFVESSKNKAKNGAKLSMTGNLGDVMKESAALAYEYIKSHAAQLGIAPELIEDYNVHIHVPDGAIPKDGPSAGITIATSLVSTLAERKVNAHYAMTGEITLRGKVMPVGGIKEKILAAKRAGISDLILCKENEKDVNEIQPLYLKGLTFHYVSDVREVLDLALAKN